MKKLRILLADDEVLIRMDLKEMIEEIGHEVVAQCSDGWEAWEKIQQLKPDLILLDIRMPKLDGLVVAQKVRDNNLGPVIMLTAFAQEKFLDKAEDCGVYGYLIKPIQKNQLKAAIQIAWKKYNDLKDLSDELSEAKFDVEKRKTLAKAKAIIMQTYRIDEQEAFRRIQKYSMNKQKSIHDIALAIIRQANS